MIDNAQILIYREETNRTRAQGMWAEMVRSKARKIQWGQGVNNFRMPAS